MDAQFHLYTAVVLDAQHNGLPVAWYITSRACTTSVESFLKSILSAGRKIRPDFQFGSVGCDDADDEINAIKCDTTPPLRLIDSLLPNAPQLLLSEDSFEGSILACVCLLDLTYMVMQAHNGWSSYISLCLAREAGMD